MTGLLSREIADYLAVRRSLGYQMARPEKLLPQLAAYLEQAGAATVTAEHALAWAVLPGASQTWHAYRLAVARGFAAWLRTIDPAAEIPPAGLIPARARRATPYLYTDEEVTALMAATESLDRRYPLRAATYRTLVGLLAATGMRVGEAIGLDRGDADLGNEVLTVRSGKNGKSRLVPLHATTSQAIGGYLRDRDRLCPDPGRSQALLVSPPGSRLLPWNVHATWKKLAASAGLRPRSGNCRPRIHDLRHSFAVRTMLDAYESGKDGQAVLAVLSTYLGHVNPKATYWYLTASPELMAAAGHRLDAWLERP
jgi:integrase